MERCGLWRMCCLGSLLLVVPPNSPAGQSGPIVGLDHIPVAVRDLEKASAAYRALGFAIKPGRYHTNGIRNAHVKFRGGSGIEPLTAGEAVDELTKRYLELLAIGEGPAFPALHARDTGRLATELRLGGYAFSRDGDVINIQQPALNYLFVVSDNRSPTDRPEHFAHQNGATALRAVWIAAQGGEELERFLVRLGGQSERRTLQAPDSATTTVVTIDHGEVVILPASHQVVPARPIIGVSFRVSDLDIVNRLLSAADVAFRAEPDTPRRVVVPSHKAHGVWLESCR